MDICLLSLCNPETHTYEENLTNEQLIKCTLINAHTMKRMQNEAFQNEDFGPQSSESENLIKSPQWYKIAGRTPR